MQVTVIRLVGYREWTESLGYDREHIIQRVQGLLHSRVVELFARYRALAHPLRYDLMIAFTNGLGVEEHEIILQELEKVSPVPVMMSIAVAPTVLEAERIASTLCVHLNSHRIQVYGQVPDRSEICIIHADIASSSSMLRAMSVYDTYMHIYAVYNAFRKLMRRLGGVALYLGGDNMLGVTTPAALSVDLVHRFAKKYRLRVGIGVDVYPRDAMRKATEALDKLRRNEEIAVAVQT